MKKLLGIIFLGTSLCASESTTSTTTTSTAATTTAATTQMITATLIFNSLVNEGMETNAAWEVARDWHPPLAFPHYYPARPADKKDNTSR